MAFSWKQIIGALAFPVSYISLVLGTMSWHFHLRETVLDNLRFMEKLKIGPFFLVTITTKVWVTSDLCNTIHGLLQEKFEQLASALGWTPLLPFLIMFCVQMVLHYKLHFSVKQMWLGSISGLASVRRPTHYESQKSKSLRFYRAESVVSSVAYTLMAGVSVTMKMMFISMSAAKAWESWISLGLSCLYAVTTQVYTRIFSQVLFPPDTDQQLPCDCVDTNKPEPKSKPEGEPEIEANNEPEGKPEEDELEHEPEGEQGINLLTLGQSTNQNNQGVEGGKDEKRNMKGKKSSTGQEGSLQFLIKNDNWISIFFIISLLVIVISMTLQLYGSNGKPCQYTKPC